MSLLRDFWNNVVGTDPDCQPEPQVCQEEPPGSQDQPQVCQDNGSTTPGSQTPADDTNNPAASSHRPLPDSTDPAFAWAYQAGFQCGQQGDGPTSRWSFEDRPYLLPEYDRGYQDGVAAAQQSPRPPDRPDAVEPSTGRGKKEGGESEGPEWPDEEGPDPFDPGDPFGKRERQKPVPEPEFGPLPGPEPDPEPEPPEVVD